MSDLNNTTPPSPRLSPVLIKLVAVSASLFFLFGFFQSAQTVYQSLAHPGFPSRTINTVGEAKVSAQPDLVFAKFVIQKNDGKFEDAQNEVSNAEKSFREKVVGLGFKPEDVMLTSIMNNNDANAVQSSRYITVEVEGADKISKLDAIYEAAKAEKIVSPDGGCIGFNDIDKVAESGRQEALNNAEEKAKRLLKPAGLRLGKLFQINDASDFYRFSRDQMQSGNCSAFPSAGAPVLPIDINVQVSSTYEVR